MRNAGEQSSVSHEFFSPDKCFTGIDIQHGSGADINITQPTLQYLFEKKTKIQIFGKAHCSATSQVQFLPPHQGQQYNLQVQPHLPLVMGQPVVGSGDNNPSMEPLEGMVLHSSLTTSPNQLEFLLSMTYSFFYKMYRPLTFQRDSNFGKEAYS